MEQAELKALAEKVTPGPWHWDSDPVKGDPLGRNRFRVVALGRTITQCYYSSGDEMAQTEASYIAAANPAEILELIAKLEDAQGEIRALRATEAGLVERVKDLEEVAAALLPFADDASAINGYGYYRPKNPHDFHPDAESCTEDEIAAHKAACEAWDAGTYKDNYGDGWVSPNVHILRAPWGIGSYTDEVPEIAAICNRARALLEKKE